MPQNHELDDVLMPPWASGMAHGVYITVGAMLPTRDGRRMGNAVVKSIRRQRSFWVADVMTDAGNIVTMTENELREQFWPPTWLRKLDPPPSPAEPSREQLEVVLSEIGAFCSARGKTAQETIIDFIRRSTIDTSEVPETGEEFFKRAGLRVPTGKSGDGGQHFIATTFPKEWQASDRDLIDRVLKLDQGIASVAESLKRIADVVDPADKSTRGTFLDRFEHLLVNFLSNWLRNK